MHVGSIEVVGWYYKGKVREIEKERVFITLSGWSVDARREWGMVGYVQEGREQVEKRQHVREGVRSDKNCKKAMGLRKGEDQQERTGMMISGSPNVRRKALMSSWLVMSTP